MTLLRVEGLGKEFGGIAAIAELSFTIEPGTIHSIIGPNGAGKTTLFNLITGLYTPSAGRVLFDDQVISGLSPAALAARGISRTFQTPRVVASMSAIDNVMIGAHCHLDRRFLTALLHLPSLRRRDHAARADCAWLMDRVGLGGYRDAEAGQLPYGALKRLEIARALAARPRLLLLDEPAAGLNASESREIDRVIQGIAADGITVVLVEHDMKMVMGISDHILALDYGRKLAEGTPAEVRTNPEVIAAYLGAQATA